MVEACMMLSKLQRLVGSEIDAVHFRALLSSIVETFLQHVLNVDLEIKCRAEVVAADLAYVSAMDRIQARRKWLMLDAQSELPGTHSFP